MRTPGLMNHPEGLQTDVFGEDFWAAFMPVIGSHSLIPSAHSVLGEKKRNFAPTVFEYLGLTPELRSLYKDPTQGVGSSGDSMGGYPAVLWFPRARLGCRVHRRQARRLWASSERAVQAPPSWARISQNPRRVSSPVGGCSAGRSQE